MTPESNIDSRIASLKTELAEIDRDILRRFPVETYVRGMRSLPDMQLYRNFPPELLRNFQIIHSSYGKHALALYHKLALAVFVKESEKEIQSRNIPGSVLELYRDWFQRVMDDMSKQKDDFYDHNTDMFCKDLGVCSLRMSPVGCELVEISGIGRRLFFTGGWRQFFRYMRCTIFKMGGFKPLYAIHLDMRYLDGFNPGGRDRCYVKIGEMLKLNPRIKGMFGVSWFYDPKIENISPRLAYLRKRPERNGAVVIRVGSSERDIRLSTLKSPTRRRLYHEGKYKPTGYMIVWPRRDLIAWAERQERTCADQVTEALVDNRINALTEEIQRTSKDILPRYPVETYIDIVKSYPELHFYRNTHPRLAAVFEEIGSSYDFHALALYHKLAMSCFIKDSIRELGNMKLPYTVYCLYHEWFKRIIDDFMKQPDDFYSYKKDLFCKDLAVCSLRLIPIGFLLEVSGIGRTFLGTGGLKQFLNGMYYMIFKMHGLKPFYSVHLDMRYLKQYFSKEAWAFCYLNIADLLELNPGIKGMIGGSWFYDPQLEHVSPGLAHLRTVPEQFGGKVYRIGTSEQDLRLAAANSPKRTELIMEGKYKPTHYVIIWPRKGLIEWAEQYLKDHRAEPGDRNVV